MINDYAESYKVLNEAQDIEALRNMAKQMLLLVVIVDGSVSVNEFISLTKFEAGQHLDTGEITKLNLGGAQSID